MKAKIYGLWKNYNLSIVLLFLFLTSWLGQLIVQYYEVRNEAYDKGKIFEWSDWSIKFWSSTLENWQSEFLQLFTFVVLTAYLIHKNSHESRDSDDRIESKLDKIIALLEKKRDSSSR